jgi:hypothetical protein
MQERQRQEANPKTFVCMCRAHLYNSLQCLIKVGRLKMARKAIVEQAAEKVGYGLAMAENVAGSVKAAVSAAVTTLAKSPKKESPAKAPKQSARKTVKQQPAPPEKPRPRSPPSKGKPAPKPRRKL